MTMRVLHRYLGFFLVGIMTVYAISGIVLIYRDSDVFKVKKQVQKTLDQNLSSEDLGQALRIRDFKVQKTEGEIVFFETGTYNSSTGEADYSTMQLPYVLDKLTHLHKARSQQPLFFLNIFFGLSLLFFVVSSFWMFIPSTSVFKKGMYFVLGGIVFTLILLFV